MPVPEVPRRGARPGIGPHVRGTLRPVPEAVLRVRQTGDRNRYAIGDVLPALRTIAAERKERGAMLKRLKEEVLEANLELVRRGLVLYTFGNASGISRDEGLVAIKPSGVPYETMKPSDIVIVDLEGRVVEGNLRPSSDVDTHVCLYQAFPAIGGVVHTHSRAATSWAQAAREIPCLGTTHADYFYGPVPVAGPLTR